MQFVFFDTETSSTNSTFGQMLEFSAVICNDKLECTGEQLTIESRLRPHIIPELSALLVTNKTIEEINSRKLSHYQMVMEIVKVSRKWTPSTWIGWNTIEFDFKWLRQAFYQCLQQPYFHQFYGNRRADALTVARANHLLGEKKLSVTLNKRGRPSFKLEELAKANKIVHNAAHTALSDVHATIEVAKLTAKKSPKLWANSLLTSSKEDTESIVWKTPIFITTESVFGLTTARVMTAICHHPVYDWTMAIDLKTDPKSYVHMDGIELKRALRSSPKVLRTVKTSSHPIILGLEVKDKIEGYRTISLEKLEERAKLLQKDIDLKKKITKILLEEYEEKTRENTERAKEPEEKIHEGYLLPVGEEETLLKIFESEEAWEKRYALSKDFKDKRLYDLAMRIIFEEFPEALPSSVRLGLANNLKTRLNTEHDVPWTTIKKAESDIKALEDKKKTAREVEILESYKEHINKIKYK